MPNRVRLIGSHPNYSAHFGGQLTYYIKASWNKKFPTKALQPVKPLGFREWAHWKKTIWYAKKEGTWIIKMFREARQSDIRKSLYGKSFFSFGMPIKQLKKQRKRKLNVFNYKANAGDVDRILVAQAPRVWGNGDPIPAQPPANPAPQVQAQRAYMEVNGRQYMWEQVPGAVVPPARPLYDDFDGPANLRRR